MGTCFWLSTLILLLPTFGALPNKNGNSSNSRQPSKVLVDARQRLSITQRKVFDVLAANEFAGCQSPWTLAYCLDKQPNHLFAQQLASILVKGIELGIPNHSISALMAQTVTGPFCANPQSIPIPQAPSKGSKQAAITVIEFADFRCGHCKEAIPMVDEMLEAFPKEVQLFYIPVTLGGGHSSLQATKAAWAAHRQHKFWPMHQALFAQNSGLYDNQTLLTLAKSIPLDLTTFQRDLVDPKLQQEIEQLQQLAEKVGLTGTPTFYINGRPFQPNTTLFSLKQRIELELLRTYPPCQ